jgi:hypothetical protein
MSDAAVDDQLDSILGTDGLSISFYKPTQQINGGPYYGSVTLRDAAGDLILLGHQSYRDYIAEGDAFDIGRAGWLEPGSEAYDAWAAPFGEMVIHNGGCAPRDALRPGSETETPLSIEFTGDNGPVAVYDRNIEYGVQVGGQSFDIVVSDAFSRNELNCGDCPVTEGIFLILRSAR